MTDTRTPAQIAEDEAREAQDVVSSLRRFAKAQASKVAVTQCDYLSAAIDRALLAKAWAQAERTVEACQTIVADGEFCKWTDAECDRLRKEWEEAK